MPMNDNATPESQARNRFRREVLQPSEATLDFLRNFARTFVPTSNQPSRQKTHLLN